MIAIPKNLNEALMMDLKTFQFQDEKSLSAYLKWLISEVYMQKSGNMETYTHRYIDECKQKGLNVNDELVRLSPLANKYLRVEDLFNHITKYVLNGYLTLNQVKEPHNENEITSFYDVILKTLIYYQDKFNKNFESDTEAFIEEILRNYLIYDRVEVFSKSNGTRDYVIKKGKNNIIEEIKMCTNYAQEDLNITIDDFSELAAQRWMLLNQNSKDSNLDDITNAIRGNITSARLNDKQKSYLLSELENGNIDTLESYVPPISGDLINAYKSAKGNVKKPRSI